MPYAPIFPEQNIYKNKIIHINITCYSSIVYIIWMLRSSCIYKWSSQRCLTKNVADKRIEAGTERRQNAALIGGRRRTIVLRLWLRGGRPIVGPVVALKDI